jgi:hypothetical protein
VSGGGDHGQCYLLISRPFPPKFSKPPKKSSSTRFFCSTKNIFRRAVCRRQSRFFRVLITPNPVFSTPKVCVQRHPKVVPAGRRNRTLKIILSTFGGMICICTSSEGVQERSYPHPLEEIIPQHSVPVPPHVKSFLPTFFGAKYQSTPLSTFSRYPWLPPTARPPLQPRQCALPHLYNITDSLLPHIILLQLVTSSLLTYVGSRMSVA